MWHVACEMWHVTCDTWHVTCYIWCVVNFLSKFQLFSFYGLGFKMFWRFWRKGWLTQWTNELMNDEAVCRTAPATPGLLKRVVYNFVSDIHSLREWPIDKSLEALKMSHSISTIWSRLQCGRENVKKKKSCIFLMI